LKHSWIRDPPEEWKALKDKQAERFPGWVEIFFECSACGCVGHVMYKDGPVPDAPAEAQNILSKQVVDVDGDCNEQIVDNVHAF
jgi:hypothetical protein